MENAKLRPYKFVIQIISLVSEDEFQTVSGEYFSDPVTVYGLQQTKDFIDSVGELGDAELPQEALQDLDGGVVLPEAEAGASG